MSVNLETVEAQASYGVGLELGQQLKLGGLKDVLLPDAIAKGLSDALNDREPAVDVSMIHNALRELQNKVAATQSAQNVDVVQKGRLFLEENKKRQDIVTTPSGLQYLIVQAGDGVHPASDGKVKVHYVGRNINGQVFDSSVAKGEPIEFEINAAVPGLKEALELMSVGAKWQVFIPSELGYGEQDGGALLPPNSTLVFDIELLEIL